MPSPDAATPLCPKCGERGCRENGSCPAERSAAQSVELQTPIRCAKCGWYIAPRRAEKGRTLCVECEFGLPCDYATRIEVSRAPICMFAVVWVISVVFIVGVIAAIVAVSS